MTIKGHPSFDPEKWLAAQEREQEKVRAIEAVQSAWTNAGPYPEYHYRMQASLRDQWPTLGYALDRLAKTL